MTKSPDHADPGLALEFTGERFTPECVREIWYEHWHRYALASRFADGKRVLDLACGEGYGSALLARHAKAVTGVDLDEQAIVHARQRYPADNLDFVRGNATEVPAEDASFDLVVSFETIEHLAEQAQMLDEFRRVLKPEGLLIISSPDRARYSDATGYVNEFHVRELYRSEFESLLAGRFPAVRLLGQQLMFHSCIWPLEGDPPAATFSQTLTGQSVTTTAALDGTPLYLLAACAAEPRFLPPELGANWLFADAEQSVYDHYQHEIGKNMQAGTLLAERDARIQELERALAQLQGEQG